MKTDFLIIGQGIAGTLLSYRLLQAGYKVMVIDDGARNIASFTAGAVINPLGGRQWTPAPDAALFIPEAIACYRQLEMLLQKPLLQQVPMYIFDAEGHYPDLSACTTREKAALKDLFYTTGQVYCNKDVWLVDAAALLETWNTYLLERGALRIERYQAALAHIESDSIQYKDIKARKIIFCEGAAGAANPLLTGLPFTRNRGEALLLHIPELPGDAVYHRKLRLVPREEGLFWYGSNYQWQFDNLEPDQGWKTNAIQELQQWLRPSFSVVDHIVAERPTTAGQVPLIGLHPHWPSVAVFNGLGTRGFSSGPFWAGELAQQLLDPGYGIRNYRSDWLRSKLG